jgi:hypothetical protein
LYCPASMFCFAINYFWLIKLKYNGICLALSGSWCLKWLVIGTQLSGRRRLHYL